MTTLGVHLLLAWNWRIAHPPAPPGAELREEQVFKLIPVPPPSPALPQVRPTPPLPRSSDPAKRPAGADGASARAVPAPEPITPPPQAPASLAEPVAVTAPSAPAEASLGAMVGRAKSDAVAIDRETREGKPGVLDAVDTPTGRLVQAHEAAYKDNSKGLTSESYTAPDGQVIYRFRQGGKVWCRTGGSVRPQIGGAAGGGATQFDTGGRWRRRGADPLPGPGGLEARLTARRL